MILAEAAGLLTTYPGNLVYHLTLTITLAVLFGASQARHVAHPDDKLAGAWRLATGGLLTLRLLAMTAAGLAWLSILDGNIVLPPLDRFASFAGVLLLAWALLQPRSDQNADLALGAGLALAIIGSVATAFALLASPSSVAFNQTLADLFWGLAGMLAGVAGALLIILDRREGWHLRFGAFLILILGFAFHLVIGSTSASLAGLVRLGELTAYPLIAVLAVRAFLVDGQAAELAPEVEPVQAVQPPLVLPGRGPDTIVGLTRLSSVERIDELAESAVQAVGRAMRAEFCLLLSAPDERGDFSIATGYDLIRERYLPGKALDSGRFPVISSALARRRSLRLPSQSRSPDLQALRAALQLDTPTSALMAPLEADDEVHGGLLLLSPYARRSWSRVDRQLLDQVAGHLGKRFAQLKRGPVGPGSATTDGTGLLEDAQHRIQELETENQLLLQELGALAHAAEAETTDDLKPLIHMHEEAQRTIESLEAEIERLNAVTKSSSDADYSEQIDKLASELQAALRELAETRSLLHKAEARTGLSSDGDVVQEPDMEAIASIAQELRQPMSSILGYTDLLLSESVGLLGAMQRKFLERVRLGIDRMGTLLGDLIQVTALETGSLSLQTTRVDPLHCIEEAVMQSSSSLRERNLAIRMDLPDQLPFVLGNEDAIVQIMVHLIENAIGASPEGGEIVATAQAKETPDGNFLMMVVSDAGDGIPAEDLGRVFQRVYGADHVLIQGVGDRGVGLSLVKALSEAIGGRVWVDSEVGLGSTFTVLMPYLDDEQEAEEAGQAV